MDVARTIDASGKACPLPIVELAKALRSVAPGAIVLLVATDPGVQPDVRAFCRTTGNELIRFEEPGGRLFHAYVRRVGR